MKNKLLNNKFFIIGALLVFGIFFYKLSVVDLSFGDDPWFRKYTSESIFSFITWRWETWSSRVILEGILLLMLKLPVIVWKTITALMFVLIFYSFLKIIKRRNNIFFILITIWIICSIDFELFGGAGWYATTINYIWVFALGIYVLSFLLDFIKGRNIKKYQWITVGISLLVATNQEQMCAIILGFYLLGGIYSYFKTKKVDYKILAIIIVCLLSMGIHLFAPGNGVRKISEMSTFYPEYIHLNILQKLYLGIVTTISPFLQLWNWPLFSFFILVAISGIIRRDKKLYLFSFIPLIVYFLEQKLFEYGFAGFLNPINFYLYTNGVEVGVPSISKTAIFVTILIVVLLLLTLFIIYKGVSVKCSIIVGIILIAAICSRLVLCLSPSLFASGMRTFIFMYFLICIGSLYLLNEMIKQEVNK